MYMEVLSDTLLLVTFSKTHVFLIIVFGLWVTPAQYNTGRMYTFVLLQLHVYFKWLL